MHWKNSIISFAILAVLCGSTAFYQENQKGDPEKDKLKIYALLSILERAHYQPQDIDDDFSEELFDTYVERIDYSKRYLTQQDVDALNKYRYLLDDQLKERSTEFFDASLEIIESRVEWSKDVVRDILSRPFDFSIKEEIERDSEKRAYAQSMEELKDIWRKTLKYETIEKYRKKIEAQNKDEEGEEEKKSLVELEKESRESILENYEKWFERMDKLRRNDRFGDYLNTVASMNDPHTNYFSPKEKEDFDINMGRALEGIGARLTTDGDFVKVSSIVPGGPAWKEGSLEVDDRITKVAQQDEEPVDIVGMRMDDAVRLIRGKKGTKVTLDVTKVDGTDTKITIVRDKVILDEGKAKSALLTHSEIIENVGYIHLPRFYADFNDPNGNSCADDVAKEVEKLKEAGVSGIIFDLRNNGGGSLNDVVEMTGLFIEEGPVVQVHDGDKKKIYRDKDPMVRYDGPLVVLVNQNSASASEILAAALQDYERAVIVGSKQTFGKGTVQRFIDLDKYIRTDSLKPLGEVKVTMQKFYRIDGGSTQLRGVRPDIVLPDSYHLLESGESEYDNAMPWSEIDALEYENTVYKVNNMKQLQENSYSRISQSPEFDKVMANAQRLKKLRDEKSFPLDFESYNALVTARETEAEQYKKIFEKIPKLTAQNHQVDLDFIGMDTSRVELNNRWIENIEKDHYILEGLRILKDMDAVSYTKSQDPDMKK